MHYFHISTQFQINLRDRYNFQKGWEEERSQILNKIRREDLRRIHQELGIWVVKTTCVQSKGTDCNILNDVLVEELEKQKLLNYIAVDGEFPSSRLLPLSPQTPYPRMWLDRDTTYRRNF